MLTSPGIAAAAAEGGPLRVQGPVDAVRRVHGGRDAVADLALEPDAAEHAAEALLRARRIRVAHHGHRVGVAEVAAAQHDVGAPAVDRAHVQLRLLPVHAVGALRVQQRGAHGEVGRRPAAGGLALAGVAFLVLVPALEQPVVRVSDQGGGAVVGDPQPVLPGPVLGEQRAVLVALRRMPAPRGILDGGDQHVVDEELRLQTGRQQGAVPRVLVHAGSVACCRPDVMMVRRR